MTLFYDMQSHRPSLYVPPECTGRERQTVIAEIESEG